MASHCGSDRYNAGEIVQYVLRHDLSATLAVYYVRLAQLVEFPLVISIQNIDLSMGVQCSIVGFGLLHDKPLEVDMLKI